MSLKNEKPPCARLCHIVKWDDFDGYGFNLHAEKGKNGQFIGKVDEGSPSQAAGLRQGDRIIEVNEINIANETHKQVVERIKAFPNEAKLLVVDQEADDYFKANNIVIKGTMPNVKVIKTPERNPNAVEHEDREEGSISSTDENTMKSSGSNDTSRSESTAATTAMRSGSETDQPQQQQPEPEENQQEQQQQQQPQEPARPAEMENGNGNVRNSGTSEEEVHAGTGNGSVASNSSTNASEPGHTGLNLKMSAKELRAQLAARKKYDPKKESIGFKDKFDIVQKL